VGAAKMLASCSDGIDCQMGPGANQNEMDKQITKHING